MHGDEADPNPGRPGRRARRHARVVDCSLVLYALGEAAEDEILRQRLSEPRVLNAPHLIDVEVSNALRGLTLGGKLTTARADAIRADFAGLHIERMPGQAPAGRMWELRNNYTAYDAASIALAELLACPLLTGDAKLLGPDQADAEPYSNP